MTSTTRSAGASDWVTKERLTVAHVCETAQDGDPHCCGNDEQEHTVKMIRGTEDEDRRRDKKI